jgi:succinate dehydrogenase / fumarate reductase flavoprotein subunit
VPGTDKGINSELEKAERVADYIELASLMTYDALSRNESCGAHFRSEYQTEDGEALRNDEEYQYVSVWGFNGVGIEPELHKEELKFEELKPTIRSYK